MSERLLVLTAVLALSGCNCFVPVEECIGKKCLRLDGGKADAGRDGGAADAGAPSDGGGAPTACAVWDGGGVGECAAITGYVATGTACQGECVLYPIATPGVFPTLAACTACGCDRSKLSAKPAQAINDTAFCDEVAVSTTIPRLLDEAFDVPDAGPDGGGDFDGGCVAIGAVGFECHLWGKGQLGDAGVARLCAATLVPSVTDVQCRVFIK